MVMNDRNKYTRRSHPEGGEKLKRPEESKHTMRPRSSTDSKKFIDYLMGVMPITTFIDYDCARSRIFIKIPRE